MSRLEELVAELCPDGVEYRSLGEIGTMVRGSGLQKTDFTETGVGCIHYGQIHTYFGAFTFRTKTCVAPELARHLRKVNTGDLVIATTSEDTGALCKCVAWLGSEEIVAGGHTVIFRHDQDPRYLSYCFQTNAFFEQKRKLASGTKVIEIAPQKLARIVVPLPPLPVQREIVRILDTLTELTSELKSELTAELTARQKQYEYYRDLMLTFDDSVPWLQLREVCRRVSTGGTPLKAHSEYYGGSIPWLRTQEVRFVDIKETEQYITELGLENSSAKWIPANCVIVAISGASAGRCAVNKIPLTTNQHCCNLEIREDRALYRYVFHWISSQYENLKALGQGARSDLNVERITSYPIPVPPLAEQARIVGILDRFSALCNDLTCDLRNEIEARRNQYQHCRDRLLDFKEKGK